MTAFNVVRFRVKPGRDQEFIDAHKAPMPDFAGMRRFSLFNTGEGTYCIVGEWDSIDYLAAARPGMIGMLDTFRHLLDEVGDGLGVTDPVSGEAVVEAGPARAKKKKKAPAKKRAAARAKPMKKAAKKPAKTAAKKTAKRAKRR